MRALQPVLGQLEAFVAVVSLATCAVFKNSVTVSLTAFIARKDV